MPIYPNQQARQNTGAPGFSPYQFASGANSTPRPALAGLMGGLMGQVNEFASMYDKNQSSEALEILNQQQMLLQQKTQAVEDKILRQNQINRLQALANGQPIAPMPQMNSMPPPNFMASIPIEESNPDGYVQYELPLEFDNTNTHTGNTVISNSLTKEDKEFFTSLFSEVNENIKKIYSLIEITYNSSSASSIDINESFDETEFNNELSMLLSNESNFQLDNETSKKPLRKTKTEKKDKIEKKDGLD